jgi:hypothetical protein
MQWGGDVSNVATGDGGETFWLWWLGDGCNYQNGPADEGFVSNWSPYEVNGEVPYWEAPIWISNHFPDRCYTAGYINGTSGSHILKLTAQPGQICTSEQLAYDFQAELNGRITALAISPLDSNYFYAATDNGYFCESIDGGQTWSNVLVSNSMYPRAILPSKINLGEVWMIGSGYSNSPVFHSENNGVSWTALDQGLLSCIAEAIVCNDDESLIFLATSIGPFVLEAGSEEWADLSQGIAPLVHYMDAEFISSTNTARFATYARGIWDYQIDSDVAITELTENANASAFPNPCRDFIEIKVNNQLSPLSFVIYGMDGKVIRTGLLNSSEQRIDTRDLHPGSYYLKLIQSGEVLKFIKN